jgi:hypothetical protein
MKHTTLGFLIILATGINSAIWLGLKNQPGISSENGPMENFQAACLIACALLWFLMGVRSKIKGEQILWMGLALFHFSFLILEVDIRHLEAPVLNKIFNGKIRDAWLGFLWLVLGICFLKKRSQTWREFLSWLKSPSGILLVVSGLFWLASGVIDKALTGHKELYHEELMEVNGSLLMIFSALWALRKGNLKTERVN